MKPSAANWHVKIDQICDRFEGHWRSGQIPGLKPFVSELVSSYVVSTAQGVGSKNHDSQHLESLAPADSRLEELRCVLLGHLIGVDCWYRQENNLPEAWEQYELEFPQHSELILEIRASLKGAHEPAKHPTLGPFIAEFRSAFQRLLDSNPGEHANCNQDCAIGPPDGSRDLRAPNMAPVAHEPLEFSSRYRQLKFLAKGGLGVVSVASDEVLKRNVAIKSIQPRFQNDPLARRRFLNEAKITARLNHPGVVPVYNIGLSPDGIPFYAMRIIPGQSLRDAIAKIHLVASERTLTSTDSGQALSALRPDWRKFQSSSFRDLIQRLITACNTVHYAHDQAVIHRDLKPANIMLGDYGETIVVDWGVAKLMASNSDSDDENPTISDANPEAETDSILSKSTEEIHTEPGMILGTIEYLSPEQASGAAVSKATDIYSLGATLFEILTGLPPISGTVRCQKLGSLNKSEQLELAKSKRLVSARDLDSTIPKALEAICRQAMAPHPHQRYQSAKSLADDLQSWLANESVTAYRESASERTWRWLRKHPSWSSTITLTPLALLLVSGIGWMIARSYGRELESVNRQLDRTNSELASTNSELESSNQRLAHSLEEIQRANTNEREARNDAEKNLSYLVNAFSQASPTFGGANTKVSSVLKDAASKIDTDFPDDNVSKADILVAIGKPMVKLGMYQDSELQLQRARKIFAKLLQPEDSKRLAAEYEYGIHLQAMGRYSEVIELFEPLGETIQKLPDLRQTMLPNLESTLGLAFAMSGQRDRGLKMLDAILQKQYQSENPDWDLFSSTLASRGVLTLRGGRPNSATEAIQILDRGLGFLQSKGPAEYGEVPPLQIISANAHLMAGNRQETLRILEAAVPRCEKSYGIGHTHTIQGTALLAYVYRLFDQGQKSMETYERVARVAEENLGQLHDETLAIVNNYADTCAAFGQLEKAFQLWNTNLQRREQAWGAQSPRLVTPLGNLGSALKNAGRFEEAVVVLKKGVDLGRLTDDGKSNQLIYVLNNLATTYGALKKSEQSIECFDQALNLVERIGKEHPTSLVLYKNYARQLCVAGHLDDALPWFERVIQTNERVHGPHSQPTLDAKMQMANGMIEAGQAQFAIEPLTRLAEDIRKHLGEDHIENAWVNLSLGKANLKIGQLQNAVKHNEVAIAHFRKAQNIDRFTILDTQLEIANIYRDMQEFETAIRMFSSLIKELDKSFSPSHPLRLEATDALATCCAANQDGVEAIRYRREAYEINRQKKDDRDPEVLTRLISYALTMRSFGQTAEAIPHLRVALDIRRRHYGDDKPNLAISIFNLANCLIETGRAVEAELLFAECHELRQAIMPETWDCYRAQAMSGVAMSRQKKYESAEPLIREGLKGMQKTEQADSAFHATAKTVVEKELADLLKLSK